MTVMTTVKLEGTSAEAQAAYNRYIDAIATHTIACADPKMSAEDRVSAALDITDRWREFLKCTGIPDLTEGSALSRLRDLMQAARSAHAMILGANAIGQGFGRALTVNEHAVAALMADAEAVLCNALGEALAE
ncbi:hypothetical protein NUH86_15925 [Sphingobium sp. JS3065]|uniref:hypothetical protein n=1 Tax=Sphingobium sp. JS3065 TaxID=2970925 RepID=UPI002264FD66|nr:hypothetical protein [Sphingobium sp. JS3065]UZW54942.1 hypothetical protein NUH86_15925 [Sphingobium sp. JS3065]